MKLISDFPQDDTLSELLRSLRVRSSVFCVAELSAPWAFGVEARDVASFHVILTGACFAEARGLPPIALSAGDLVVLPHGDAHALRDSPATPVTELEDMLAGHPQVGWEVRAGGDGPRTEILCGAFVLENGTTLLGALPPMLHVRGERDGSADWIASTVSLLRREMPGTTPGSEAVVARLADVVVTQAIRSWLATRDGDGLPLGALGDEQIAKAIRLVHRRPGEAWSVPGLARSVAMSRSSFSARFRELTGDTPMRYVARPRLASAAEALRTSTASVSEIAAQSGYRSLVSFTRAFKRAFGVTPAAYRRARPQPADFAPPL